MPESAGRRSVAVRGRVLVRCWQEPGLRSSFLFAVPAGVPGTRTCAGAPAGGGAGDVRTHMPGSSQVRGFEPGPPLPEFNGTGIRGMAWYESRTAASWPRHCGRPDYAQAHWHQLLKGTCAHDGRSVDTLVLANCLRSDEDSDGAYLERGSSKPLSSTEKNASSIWAPSCIPKSKVLRSLSVLRPTKAGSLRANGCAVARSGWGTQCGSTACRQAHSNATTTSP
jgi:hypothetical protein